MNMYEHEYGGSGEIWEAAIVDDSGKILHLYRFKQDVGTEEWCTREIYMLWAAECLGSNTRVVIRPYNETMEMTLALDNMERLSYAQPVMDVQFGDEL